MNTLWKVAVLVTLLSGGQIDTEANEAIYFIDAHSQVDHKVSGIKVILEKMSSNNVKFTLLTTRGKRNWRDIVDWSAKYPKKIAPLLRSKGRQYKENGPKYYEMVHDQIRAGKFVGGAEILVFHAQKGSKAPGIVVDLGDDRVSLLIDESLSLGWPVIIHIEFASLKGQERERQLDSLNSLVEKHSPHPFVLIHMGQLQPKQVRDLIERHPNIYFLTSHADPVTVNRSNQPWVNVFSPSGYRFKEAWKNLFVIYPNRFVFALDNVWDYHWQSSYDKKIEYWRKGLSKLPSNVAHLIAHGNAERLWKLK